jgi:hypothetical protein
VSCRGLHLHDDVEHGHRGRDKAQLMRTDLLGRPSAAQRAAPDEMHARVRLTESRLCAPLAAERSGVRRAVEDGNLAS